jgi:hypothetical protein
LGNQRGIPKKKKKFLKKRIQGNLSSKKKKKIILTAAKKDILSKNTDRPKLIIRKPKIPKKNGDEKLKKSLNRKNLEKS